ncbi:primosomal protein DnaI [Aneurinibacillus migulanus]|uniref:primosomal protein N' n=1 Tax=Aneurinibacillus migulanus TaxID=47500 RepID=UPI0005BB6FFF|nr:primosomal protein N' [Aneurinibacillus migulanus]KIV50405.1 primosomal protein DnaI [Aneurinibacillus migulanus]KPD06459.1 primosomal protein DnaI [Aneurinibacillus migulanus]CEH32055.1 Primosomal protein [Aneurinibacillus migulanus]
MFAQVVVDVPVVDTDRPFDYRIPESLAPFVFVGSRVSVPFGPRKLQGFVVGLADTSEVEKTRDILDVLDVEPPLTEEMVWLARRISERYMCTHYTALQSMVPAALRSSYDKQIFLTAEGEAFVSVLSDEQAFYEYIRNRQPVLWNKIMKEFPFAAAWLDEGLKKNRIRVEQIVGDRVTKKTITILSPAVSVEELEAAQGELSKTAVRQKEVLSHFIHFYGPIPQPELLSLLGVSNQAVKGLVDKGLLIKEEVEGYRDPFSGRTFTPAPKHPFTAQQKTVIDGIVEGMNPPVYYPCLLHGVTGSGKTEVYLEIMERTIDQGREAILLVPEISLTPQMVNRFKGRFGSQVAVMHSRLSQGERYDEWRKIRRGEVKVAIGARSAIFAPFQNLGLIILDEEHEGSYKQEETPRYHARTIAQYRGMHHHAVVILGSATPSMESYHEAKKGRIHFFEMRERVGNRPLPEVTVVDMREELRDGNRTMFSKPLMDSINNRLEKNEQIVMFLNRRGFSTFVMCRSCGYVAQCPHCDISLTYHRSNQTLRCHYCGYTEREPQICPECGSEHIRFFGTGTQKVEEELARYFPGIRVIRMDVDTTGRKGAHEKLLQDFREGKGDVLLGTQMIAKGLDFPNVTLVGVLAADSLLNLPDFRAAERTFQLVTQVGGRAGRHEKKGEVILQTYNTEHYSIQYASRHDYESFFVEEIKQRYEKNYPPYYRLVLFTFAHENVPLLVKISERFARKLRETIPPGAYLLGPVASPIARIKDRYRFQCMIKYKNDPRVLPAIHQVVRAFDEERKKTGIMLTVDVDPQMMM